MNRAVLFFFWASTYAWLTVLSGCRTQQAYNKSYYVLETDRKAQAKMAKTDHILEVSHFAIDSAFSEKGLVYRVDEFEYESDFYNEFLVSPSAMITEKLRNWLSETAVFKRVLAPGSLVDPTHLIEGNITELYGDFRDKSSPIAVMEIRVFLLEIKSGMGPVVVTGKIYKSTAAFESAGAANLVSALNTCLTEILVDLEEDLAQTLL
jgi:ABC-type uncharacterized transport system auxiliary subunit